MAEFVPTDFEVPLGLQTSEFVLEPLGPEHNEQDYEAWTSSMEHIAGTPGYPDGSWPREMTPDENRADLQRHADDFRKRKDFTYTVLDPVSRDVIGCVYIYPVPAEGYDACALSWVRGEPRAPGRTTLARCERVARFRPGRSAASSTRRAPRRPEPAPRYDQVTFPNAGAGECSIPAARRWRMRRSSARSGGDDVREACLFASPVSEWV